MYRGYRLCYTGVDIDRLSSFRTVTHAGLERIIQMFTIAPGMSFITHKPSCTNVSLVELLTAVNVKMMKCQFKVSFLSLLMPHCSQS